MKKQNSQDETEIYRDQLQQGWDLYYNNKYSEAEVIANDLISRYPEKSSCHYLLGHIYRTQILMQKAVDEFLKALDNDKAGESAGYIYYWLGEIYNYRDFLDDPRYIYDQKKAEHYYNLGRKAKSFPAELLLNLMHKLKGQEKTELLELGITHFPQISDFYVLLGHKYRNEGLFKQEIAVYERALAKDISTSSLFYNIGSYYYARKNYHEAIAYFEKAISNNTDYPSSDVGLYYCLGRAQEQIRDFTAAILSFKTAHDLGIDDSDSLFGFSGLLNIYLDQQDSDKLLDLIINLDVRAENLEAETRIYGGPLFLSQYAWDSIKIDNFPEIYQKLTRFKISTDNHTFLGKLWVLKCFIAISLGKLADQYKAIKNAAIYLNAYTYDCLEKLHVTVLASHFEHKFSKPSDIEKTFNYLISDLDKHGYLKEAITPQIYYVIELLYSAKEYQKVTQLANYFDLEFFKENDKLFELAYSYNEANDNQKSKSVYEYCLANKGETSAVLNNLGNIYKEDGNYKKAIELYNRGLAIEPGDEILKRNLKNTEQKKSELETKASEEAARKREFQAAIDALKFENDYVLEKLGKFIEQIKKDEGFNNWILPVAKFKFQTYIGADKQRAENLRDQWLKKGYIRETGSKDQHSVSIYSVNPYLESELIKIQKRKIPESWISGFINISVPVLENADYFIIIEKIEKSNKKFRPLLERDYKELTYNYLAGHEKATIVLSGSLVELVLTYYCEKKKLMTLSFVDARGNTKNKKLYDCVLSDLIDYVDQTKPFGQDFVHLSNLSRIYRNFIHPGRELKDKLDKSKVELCYVSVREILRRVL